MTASTALPASDTRIVIGKPLRVLAWLSFLAEVIIIGTGGAVRLTGSGLGCTEWPLCTPESLVPLPEQGIHGIIEFGNRTMTGVVGLLALAVLLLTLLAIAGWPLVKRALLFAAGGIVLGVIGFLAASPLDLAAFGFSSGLLISVIVAMIDSLRRVSRRGGDLRGHVVPEAGVQGRPQHPGSLRGDLHVP